MTSQGFLKELQRLIYSSPKPPMTILFSERCDNGNYIYYSKNLDNCFDAVKCADSAYLYDSFMCANSFDCDYAVECELCYESVDPFKSFNCIYLDYCSRMQDAYYCYNCNNCHDVFGCVSLKNKSFCIFNRQLSEDAYRTMVKKYLALPSNKALAMLEELKATHPITQTHGVHNENSQFGNYIHYCKNCFYCFDAAYNEDCGYLYDSFSGCKRCYDMTYAAEYMELSYEIIDSVSSFNCDHLADCKNCVDSSYLFHCFDVKNSLGCVALQHKEYCILNRQFTKEDYERISKPLLDELRNKNSSWNTIAI